MVGHWTECPNLGLIKKLNRLNFASKGYSGDNGKKYLENIVIFSEWIRACCRIEAYPNTINYWMKQGGQEREMLLDK